MSAVMVAERKPAGPRMTVAEVVAELEWLFTFDVHPDLAAQQLGYRPSALRRRLERHGLHDLARRFDRAEWWEVSR